MSHGIESLKAENTTANVSVLVNTEAPRSSRATAPRETGSGRQRDRLRLRGEDWGLREKRGNWRVREKRKEKMKGEEREKE